MFWNIGNLLLLLAVYVVGRWLFISTPWLTQWHTLLPTKGISKHAGQSVIRWRAKSVAAIVFLELAHRLNIETLLLLQVFASERVGGGQLER